ncbi:hypothetical protein MAR_016562 [Mya arenaria]|uniref:Uncharacterized protein n=1 Tax=Mya arenaria TaxID=6604 RepID=A0ABY7FK89_MYAAR|nr:hypothetical protein MAR_016562 [Mya arenaria]
MADTVAKTLLEQNITREGYSERESHLERALPVERCGVLYLGLILCSVKREGYSERESHLERALPVERCGVLCLGLILCSAKVTLKENLI